MESKLHVSIAAGFRWTLWLSVLALPFSYATNVLLARIGPEALGTFGVLNVYIVVVAVFLFLGGSAVPMKFLPELMSNQRTAFLASYSTVIVLSYVPWLLLAAWRPQLLQFLFGDAGTPALQLQLIYLAPIYLGFLLLGTSLKAMLEIKWAQILERGITFGLSLVLFFLLLWKPVWLRQYAANAIWCTYIGLTFVFAIIAFFRLLAIGVFEGPVRFWLPPRFWPYTLLLQANSFLGLLGTRLDYILVLNSGGLVPLGQYVAITSIAAVIPRLSGFAVDNLLPALTNCLSSGDMQATVRIAEVHFRVIFAAVLSMSLGLLLFVRPVLAVMGPAYVPFAGLVQLACIGAAAQSFNGYNNALFTASDRLRHGVLAAAARALAFVGSFWSLWQHFELAGAVTSWIISEIVYLGVSLLLLHRYAVIKMTMSRTYWGCLCTSPVAALLGHQAREGHYLFGGALVCLSIAVFFTSARYTAAEFRSLARLMFCVDELPRLTDIAQARGITR